MGNSIFGIGVSALSTAQAGLVTTGHNISNVNTAGFHRQQIIQSTNIPQFTGIGFLGQGVHVDTVRRLYDETLDSQVLQAQSQSNHLEAYYSQITQLDNMLADPNAGLSPALQDFFNAVHDVAANPSSVPSRQLVLSSAQAMVSRFQSLNQRFKEIRDGVNNAINSSVGEINSYAQQIANLNNQIVIAQSSSSNQQPANDLLDQRDQLIAELNNIVKVTTVKQDDGSLNVFIGNGQTLVVGTQSFTLAAAPSQENPEQLEVGVSTPTGVQFLAKGSLTGGSLGGLLAFRSESLDPSQNALGRVAIGLAQTFNDQHRLGMDLNGALGTNFFNLATPKVTNNINNSPTASLTVSFSNVSQITTSDYRLTVGAGATATLTRLSDNVVLFSGAALPQTVDGLTFSAMTSVAGDSFLIQPGVNGARDIGVAIADPAKIAAAAPIKTNATLANTGSGTISAGSVNTPPPPNANLLQPVTMTFHSPYDGQFDVTGTGVGLPANNQVYTAGANISFNGWTVQISGSPAAGDSFTVTTNAGGVADNRNALLLAGLQVQNTLVGNTASYQGAYSQLVSLVGNKTREIEVTSRAQDNLVSHAKQAQQAMSGVNLDEEAANLLRYQQAYQAAGKMMQVATTLFDTLLSLGN
jgi:flagellar hook-associated protein 1 FlgK